MQRYGLCLIYAQFRKCYKIGTTPEQSICFACYTHITITKNIMGTENLKNVMSTEMQWNGFFSEFALIDASVIVPVVQEEKKAMTWIVDSTMFL